MSELDAPNEPFRRVDLARLALTKLRVEDGVRIEEVFRRVTETAAEVMAVERVGVWLLTDQRRALRCANLFERSKGVHSSGATLQASEFPEYFRALELRKTIPAEVANVDPRTSALAKVYLAPLGITSILDAAIFVGGDAVGVVCHEHTGRPREWSSEERDFAGSMADLVALKMRAAEMEEARAVLRAQSQQLAEARRVDGMAELAAGVAHDFKNVLTVMLGISELIAAGAPGSAATATLARQMTAAGQRGIGLANELMAFARPGPDSSRVVCPAEVVTGLRELLCSAAGPRHPIELDASGSAGRVLLAPEQLERAVLNLVVNARDAMPEGGPIAIRITDQIGTDDRGAPGRYVTLEVTDRGTGIPAAVLPKIFDPFFTTKPRGQGTGLGLAVIQQVVNHCGGFVRVESAVGRGTTFRLFFPRISSS